MIINCLLAKFKRKMGVLLNDSEIHFYLFDNQIFPHNRIPFIPKFSYDKIRNISMHHKR